MRATALLFAGLLVTAGAAQAQQRSLLVTFANGGVETGGTADQAIANRSATRVWQDSVEVYLSRVKLPAGWRLAQPGASASFMVQVVSVPVNNGAGTCHGTALALVIFEPATLTPWKYLTSSVAIAPNAEAAADQMSSGAIATITSIRR